MTAPLKALFAEPATGRLQCNKETVAKLQSLGAKRARVVVLTGAQGCGKSTLGCILTDDRVKFPTGNDFDHTTKGIDLGILEEQDGSVTLILDCEGLLKNETALDLAMLNLVAALIEARHIHCVFDSIKTSEMDNLRLLSEFIGRQRKDALYKAQLRVALRTKRSGDPEADSRVPSLRELFQDFKITVLPELEGRASLNPLQEAAARLKEWARSAPTTYTCSELAGVLSVMVDQNGRPVDVPTLCDQVILTRLRQHSKVVLERFAAFFCESMQKGKIPALMAALRAAINDEGSCARLSPAGTTIWKAEVENQMTAQQKSWMGLVEQYEQHQTKLAADAKALLAAAEAEKTKLGLQVAELQRRLTQLEGQMKSAEERHRQDTQGLKTQREAYNQLREKTRVGSTSLHPQAFNHGSGQYPCCGRKQNEGGCTRQYIYTLPEWTDSMAGQAQASMSEKLIQQRNAYNEKREKTKGLTGGWFHPQGFIWIKHPTHGHFECCKRDCNVPGCHPQMVYTMTEWNDSMFNPNA